LYVPSFLVARFSPPLSDLPGTRIPQARNPKPKTFRSEPRNLGTGTDLPGAQPESLRLPESRIQDPSDPQPGTWGSKDSKGSFRLTHRASPTSHRRRRDTRKPQTRNPDSSNPGFGTLTRNPNPGTRDRNLEPESRNPEAESGGASGVPRSYERASPTRANTGP